MVRSTYHAGRMSAATPGPSPETTARSPADEVRRLLRSSDRAALATRMPAYGPANGWPYGSLVLLAVDQTATPLLLISDLAEHTKNIDGDARVALLVDGTAGLADPLTGARASVLGRAVPCGDPAARARYVARHPAAASYAGFKDFHLFRIEISAAHLVAGFGRIAWVGVEDILDRAEPALAQAEAEIVAHMNDEHADALALMAAAAGRGGAGWRMTGIDPEGADLRRDGEVLRIDFAARVADAAAARAELVRLTREAV